MICKPPCLTLHATVPRVFNTKEDHVGSYGSKRLVRPDSVTYTRQWSRRPPEVSWPIPVPIFLGSQGEARISASPALTFPLLRGCWLL